MGKGGKRRHKPDKQEAPVHDFLRRWLGEAEVTEIECSHLADVCDGCGTVHAAELCLASGERRSVVAKLVRLDRACTDIEQRRRDSYVVEADFYERGHADRLCAIGATCPSALHVERSEDGSQVNLCLSKLEGVVTPTLSDAQADAALQWLARLHAMYWGPRADAAVAEGGLQARGCFWHLDARKEELDDIPVEGWQGRLRKAAGGLNRRLQADQRLQTVIHGDAKAENMLFLGSSAGVRVSFCDFQYTGKANAAIDLAYCSLCVEGDMDSERQAHFLRSYLSHLTPLLEAQGDEVPSLAEIQIAFGLSMCDFARWACGSSKLSASFQALLRKRCATTLDAIDGGSALESDLAYDEAVFVAYPV